MGQVSPPYWGVAQIVVGKENFATDQLLCQGFKVFSPKLPSLSRRSRSIRPMPKPLFPGYIFVRIDPQINRWRSIMSTRGISKIIMFGEQPGRMPRGSVEQMIDRSTPEGVLQCDRSLAAGDSIRIVGGPFDDWLGEVVEAREQDRVIILLNSLARPTRVSVRRDQIRAISLTTGVTASV